MPKKPPKVKELDEDQYTRSFNKPKDEGPKSWVCRDADCAYENENMDDEECEACGDARYEEEVDREPLRVELATKEAALGAGCRPLPAPLPAQSLTASSVGSS